MQGLFIGLMSGTSLDGIDAVVAGIDTERIESIGHHHEPFDPSLRRELLALTVEGDDELQRAAEAALALGRAYAAATQRLLADCRLDRRDIKAIGAHGQTVRHRPERGFSLQLNAPHLLAELTGITVVADFRARDIAAGGQGAPLVPAFHAAVFSGERARAVVNIGGIANVTLLPPGGTDLPVRGFDTGPGNCLLDLWCERHTGAAFDAEGRWAARGRVLPELLSRMLTDPYFAMPPPKSSGREHFNDAWLARMLDGQSARPEDVQATLTALTARHIRDATGDRPLYVCGGGAFNRTLLEALAAGGPVATTDALGVPPMQVEALAFAWLAERCLSGRPGNLPDVTGARGPRVLGAVHPAG